ncbi:hypothetical protein RvY_18578 [Ramazzottius varieornatus]|uniref:Protein kinase domain-containing protein n=1 Tax=Ramazzottius varieornatus TaxID=947166 RepID=A0A1D1W6A1_RAMVA|nr:hypothetical protein RvY_18578 [Ramazzottius varieornatus]
MSVSVMSTEPAEEAMFSMAGIMLDFDSVSLASRTPSPPTSASPTGRRSNSPLTKQRMESISEEAPPVEVTVVQLLPDFDGSLEDMVFADPVSYTEEELSNLQTEFTIDDSLGAEMAQFETGGGGFIPPCLLQKIVDSTDDVESLDPEKAKKCFQPVLLSEMSSSLSMTKEGFIRMNDYKISFDSMGGGRLSEVRVAFNERDQQQYAVKILSKKKLQTYNLLLRTSRNPLEEAYREIGILQKLNHPNIIQLVEVVDKPDDDNIYIVFELLDQALMDLPTESPFSEDEARKFFVEILRGVEHLHSNKIVHRDLKPDNMLLSKKGVVKIADFGFADNLPDNEADDSESDNDVNCEFVSAVHGTPAFTPPECLRQRKHPVCAFPLDLWSLGITLYALVVGDVPYKGDTMPALFQAIRTASVEYPPQIELSTALKELISRLLDKNPSTRIRMEDVQAHPWLQMGRDADVDGQTGESLVTKNEGLHTVIPRPENDHVRS